MSLQGVIKTLFGSKQDRDYKAVKPILDKVLAGFSTVNNYTRLVMTDSESGERIEWPARLGIRQLL